MTVSFTHINFLMQPSQTARMEAWQQCTESAITLAAPTQPQKKKGAPQPWLSRRRSEREYAKYGGSHGRITERKFGGAYSSMLWWEQGATDGP